MAANTCKTSNPLASQDALARNTELFYEADRLEQAAYAIIGTSLANADAWLRFSEAKRVADAKRSEARQDLMRLRRSGL
ncbi:MULTISPECIES: hypothetical protein [unclassified Pseudomonas]|jgi:hypothetical protein|uniref:hypothetical protein n=1 Tax=unclassified Pseudomonas TaxID=196821 RepID=UPI000D0E43A4|nr:MULTISPECIES: hypothetical protein [unclassified Pseudomonas]AYF48067.1 hypothetical protein DXV65_10915 [Pseudomonas fluorescens]MBK5476437.1 hypothetical protein [Pseudomonas sp. TH21]QTV17861.1 hypothetical protein J9321_02685 [Pseudomonas fluorescens]